MSGPVVLVSTSVVAVDDVVVVASMMSGTSGSMNVVVVVTWVVDVDDEVLVVELLDVATRLVADGGGTHAGGGSEVLSTAELGAVAPAECPA